MSEKNEVWWTAPAEGEDGGTILVSGRDDMAKAMESGKYTERVEMTWRYQSGPDGMPSDADARLMEQADEALRAELKKDKGSLLTGVYTGCGERNWVLYVKNTRIFQGMINRAWATLPTLPIEIYAEKDPDWAEYREMRDATYIPDAE